MTVELESGGSTKDADWWVTAKAPFGWYHYDISSGSWIAGIDVTYQGALFTLSPYEVLNTTRLPLGTYTFYFRVDMIMNGLLDLDQMYSDSVEVTIE